MTPRQSLDRRVGVDQKQEPTLPQEVRADGARELDERLGIAKIEELLASEFPLPYARRRRDEAEREPILQADESAAPHRAVFAEQLPFLGRQQARDRRAIVEVHDRRFRHAAREQGDEQHFPQDIASVTERLDAPTGVSRGRDVDVGDIPAFRGVQAERRREYPILPVHAPTRQMAVDLNRTAHLSLGVYLQQDADDLAAKLQAVAKF